VLGPNNKKPTYRVIPGSGWPWVKNANLWTVT
jgi:hypothetical protein